MSALSNELMAVAMGEQIHYDRYIVDDNGVEFGIVCTRKIDSDDAGIAIEVVSYKDALLYSTIKSAIVQADNPDRLHFLIGYQYEGLDELYELMDIDNCQIVHIPLDKASGSCYARNLCQRLVDDEKYVLHIDPHMRFIKHWDTAFIEFLESKNDPKGFVSAYPCGVTDDECKLPLDHPKFDVAPGMYFMYTRNFVVPWSGNGEYGKLLSQCIGRTESEWASMTFDRQPMISAGYFFGHAIVDKTVKIDPNMWFYGEEYATALRLYTHGFNNYRMSKCYILHKWSHTGRSYQSDAQNQRKLAEYKRVHDLFEGKLYGEYGVGSVRTIAEYEEFSGVTFKDKLVLHHAQLGDFGSDVKVCDKEPVFGQLLISEQSKRLDKFKLRVFIFDVDGHASECMENIKSTSGHPDMLDVHIISKNAVSVKSDMQYKYNDSQSFSDFFWSAFVDIKNDDCYVMCVLSNMRFVNGWYSYYSYTLTGLSSDDVLTSVVSKTMINNYCAGSVPCKIEYTGNNKVVSVDVRKFKVSMSNMATFDAGCRMHSYLSDCFLIAKSSVFFDLIKDSNVSFYAMPWVLSARLFMQGYNLFYGNRTYLYQNVLGDMDKLFPLHDAFREISIVGGKAYSYSRLESPLKAGWRDNMNLANLRSVFAFHSSCGFNFDKMMPM